MEYKTTLQLANELGMMPELEEHLSTESNCSKRFSQAIEDIVSAYQGENPSIKSSRKVWSGKYIDSGVFRAENIINNPYNLGCKKQYEDMPYLKKIENFSRALDFFRQKYGVGTNQKSTKKISEETGLSRQTVLNGLNFVKELISQKHKRDIWYATVLGDDKISSTEYELIKKYGKLPNWDLDDFITE